MERASVHRAGASLVALVLALASTGAGRGPVDLELALQVLWGDESMGPESLRAEVEQEVLRQLERAGCFATVRRAPGEAEPAATPPPDLLYRITLSNLETRENWEVSIADRTAPDRDPSETENRVEAMVGFDVLLELSSLPEERPLRTRSYRHENRYRPLYREDPREAVRLEVIDDLSRDATAFACRKVAKLPAELERARAASGD